MKKFIIPLILCLVFPGDLSAGMTYRQPKQETDPVFSSSEAASITSTDTTNWDTAYLWGDHAGLYLPINGVAASVNGLTITPGASISGNNTGDQVADGVTITGAGTVDDPFEASIPAGTNKRTISFTIDGNYAPPAVDDGDCVRPAYSGTITGWYIDSKVSGSIVVDVKKNGSSIAGTEKPTLSSATSNSDNNLTTWTTSLTGGDQICFEVDSASTLTKANVALVVEATT